MSLLNDLVRQIQGGVAQINPFDGGANYQSVTRRQQPDQGAQQARDLTGLYDKLAPYQSKARQLPYTELDGTYNGHIQGTSVFRDNADGLLRFDPSGRDIPQFSPSIYPVLPIDPNLTNRFNKIDPIAETYRR